MRSVSLLQQSAFYRIPATATFLLVALPTAAVLCAAPATSLAARRRFGRRAMRLALSLIHQPLRVRGGEHLPTGPCVVVANHASYLDGLLLTAALPERFTFVVHDGAAHTPVVGPTIRRMGVTFVNRDNAREGGRALLELGRRLAAGESFAVFPEGGFVGPPGLRAFHPGAFRMAAMAGVPVVPVAIRGSRGLLGDGARLFRFSPVEIEILPALPPPAEDRRGFRATAAAARRAILAHLDEPDSAPAITAP